MGYCKLGRSMPLLPTKTDSDDEPVRLLSDLAHRHPDDTFVLLGHNSGETPETAGLPPNVVNPWTEWRAEFAKLKKGSRSPLPREVRNKIIDWGDATVLPEFRACDAVIDWIGQHGNTNSFIPPVGKRWEEGILTNTYDEFILYGSYMVRGINAFRADDPVAREEIYVVADARNYLKARDVKWPLLRPVLGQFDFKRLTKFERYGDKREPRDLGFEAKWESDHVWLSYVHYTYSRLEISGVMPWHVDARFSDDWDQRRHFGLFINEARAYVGKGMTRLQAMQEYVLPLEPAFVHGKWSDESLGKLNLDIQQVPAEYYYDWLRSVRCTFTTPSSGSGWATTKPWQAFAAGTVCFFHPLYDSQNHILRDAPDELRRWLRIDTPEQLRKRVEHLQHDRDAWTWLVREQRAHYDRAVAEARHIKMIEERVGWKSESQSSAQVSTPNHAPITTGLASVS